MQTDIPLDEYTLWVVPTNHQAAPFTKLINTLSQQTGTVAFDPHVTVLGGIQGSKEEILAKSRILAATGDPFDIYCGEVEFEDLYYRSIYVGVRSEALLHLRARAEELFLKTGAYSPHLSLAYGHISLEQKEILCVDMKEKFPAVFVAASLELWHAKGSVSEWKKLASFPLQVARELTYVGWL